MQVKHLRKLKVLQFEIKFYFKLKFIFLIFKGLGIVRVQMSSLSINISDNSNRLFTP